MKRLATVLAVIALAAFVAACSNTNAADNTPPASVDPNAVHVAAKDIKFSTAEIDATAGKSFQIVFDNQEGAPHNIAIYKDSSASQKLFGQDPVSGPTTVVYQVPALAAGTYFFRCDIHTNMTGSVVVK